MDVRNLIPRPLKFGRRLACGLTAAMMLAAPAGADITGRATIVDGDTIIVRGAVLELYGIDAIERDQLCTHRGKPWICGLHAANLLEDFVGNQTVTCRLVTEDIHGRRFALCRVQNLDLGAEMVSQGYAFNFPRFSRDYRRQIQEARQRGAGIWDSIYVDPEEWRMWKR